MPTYFNVSFNSSFSDSVISSIIFFNRFYFSSGIPIFYSVELGAWSINTRMSLCMHVVLEVSRGKSSYSIERSIGSVPNINNVFSYIFPLSFAVHFHKHEYDLPVFQFHIKTDRFQAVSIKYSSSSQLKASCKV